MFAQVSEKRIQLVRWLLTVGWILLIFSLFYDPISAYLPQPDTAASILTVDSPPCPEVLTVQGNCLNQKPYPLGAIIFWEAVIPSSILILLVFGHETWRRICPLSFISQIPRALGWQRQRKIVNPQTGVVHYELVKIGKDSWLGRNHLYLQFALLCLGLCLRILLVNSHAILLGSFLILTILSAILVGYLFAGKSWCHYFCPMAPVQMVYTGPRALWGSKAHQSQRQTITQSMCRTGDQAGHERMACVNCKSPCLDIDTEGSYWQNINQPGRKFVQYGYVGLVIGFYLYYFLYSGNINYYYYNAFNPEENQLITLFNPGFYIFNQAINIPKIIAAPFTITVLVWLSYFLCNWLEKLYKTARQRRQKPRSKEQVRHVIFSICTFVVFNIFFIFCSRPLLMFFPNYMELGFNALVAIFSTLWLYKTLNLSAELYLSENLHNILRRQISKLTIDFSELLKGSSWDELTPEQVDLIANVIAGFDLNYRLQVYQGVLQETLAQGTVNPADSLQVLKEIRLRLRIKDQEHFTILTKLGLEDPDLLDPRKRHSRENQLRLESYRQAMEMQLLKLVNRGISLEEALQQQDQQIQALKLEYGITPAENAQILSSIFDDNSAILHKADVLLEQLKELAVHYQLLSNLVPDSQAPAFALLRLIAVEKKQHMMITQLLSILEILADTPDAKRIATTLSVLTENVLIDMLQRADGGLPWRDRLHSEVLAILQTADSALKLSIADESGDESVMSDSEPPTFLSLPGEITANPIIDNRRSVVIDLLKQLLQEVDPLVVAIALSALSQLEPQLGQEQAQYLLTLPQSHWLVQETAANILAQDSDRTPAITQTLIAQTRIRGETQEKVFQQPVIRIGRSQINEIIIPDPPVAQQHAILYLDSQGLNLIDLGSAQGLYVGSKLVQNNRQRLNQGDVIRFSSYSSPAITVHWQNQPIQSQTPPETLTTLEKLFLLFESNFFRSLTPEALIELAGAAEIRVYHQGASIFQVGEPSRQIILLIDGTADVTILLEDSEQMIIPVDRGQTIGEIGVLTGKLRSASLVTTSEPNRILVIDANKFEALVRQNSELARSLLTILSQRLQQLTPQVKERV